MSGFSLQDLSVSRKLGLGFGLLLAFALLLALTGLYGLHGSSESLQRINRLGALFDEVVFTREANFSYALNADASLLDTHREHLQAIGETLATMIAAARDGTWPASDLAPLLDLQAQLESYRQTRDKAADASAVVAANQLLAELLDDANKLYLAEETRAAELVARSDFWLAALALAAMLFGTLAALVISRQIALPLRHAVAAARRIADGDLTEALHSQRRDELGTLLCSLHTMNGSLRTVISQIGSGAHQIAASASQLAVATTQTQAGIDCQRGDTDSVASAMNQMTATVQEVARHSEQTARAARGADQEACGAHELSQTAIARIEALATEIGVSAESMGRLKQESDRIGGILNVIKEVADQTNLLALNAAIEAARAGEAGRGFAVVADEVRNLAQRTQQSSGEIEQLIVELQHIADEGSRTMQNSVEQTQASVAGVRDTGAALEVITRQVADIQQMSELIASAADQQTTVAEEINRSVVRVRGTAEESASASAEISAASSELERLGRDLDALVGHFRT